MFKKGDVVRCVQPDDCNQLTQGGTYVVNLSKKYTLGTFVWLTGVGSFRASRFELVKVNNMIKIGDTVLLSEQGQRKWSETEWHPAGVEGTVVKPSFTYMEYTVHWDNGYINSYQKGDLELVSKVNKMEELVNGLTSKQKKELKNLLDNTKVTLYSVTGQKWGKKKLPDSTMVMTYSLKDGGLPCNIKVLTLD